MKILVVTNMYPSLSDPAFGIFVKNFYNYISGHHKEGKTDIIAIKGREENHWKELWKYVVFYIRIFTSCLFKRYDLIYVHTITFPIPPLRIVSIFRKLPLAFNIHGSDLISQSRLAEKLKKMSFPLLRQAKLIVVPSALFKYRLLKEVSDVKPNIVYVSPSGGIDSSVFVPMEHSHSDKCVLGFVSHIISQKGWRIFVDAVLALRSKGYAVNGIMAGNGNDESELSALLSTMNDSGCIDYIGVVPQKDLPLVYNQMDLFVFPTLYFESLGLVGVEAMACGVPVVASNCGGPTSYVKHGENGFLFEQGNVEDLVNQIECYINMSREQKAEMSEKAKKTAEQYDREYVMSNLLNVILKTKAND